MEDIFLAISRSGCSLVEYRNCNAYAHILVGINSFLSIRDLDCAGISIALTIRSVDLFACWICQIMVCANKMKFNNLNR